jgi:hypothetical protein
MIFPYNQNNDNKNEKDKVLDELIRDFGFDKDNLDKAIEESPDLDLNDIISNLMDSNNNKNEVQEQPKEQFNSINMGMGNIFINNLHLNEELFPVIPQNSFYNENLMNLNMIPLGLNSNQGMNLMNQNSDNNINLNSKEKKEKNKKRKKDKKDKKRN